MLKKSILIIAALLFAFGILAVSVSQASAEEIKEETKVDYYLPYPGILPDHFLYPIKRLRDKILLFLTTHPVKRAERLLHFADKRIGAAQLLIEIGKNELAIKTATGAENYLNQAIEQQAVAADKGEEIATFRENLFKAIRKHEEILLTMVEEAEGEMQKQLREIYGRTYERHQQMPH